MVVRIPELLAPAGSPQALRAAVAAGADAVYLSGKRFGARMFSANFTEPELKWAVDYAHLRGVKVYVTVNTLIREDELPDLARYLLQLYALGTDALLVQDLGAAKLARELVPDLDLHASTQMTIHNSAGVAWAGSMGFKRAVLAREVSLEEVAAMKDSGIGLEVFVHGALCYCYSGQCLLSSAIGGRSGNRGMCAQPCRKPYVLLRGKKDQYGRPVELKASGRRDRYLLSTRDLAAYRHLDRIVRSPVESLKIEGRMKSPEYVSIVTSIYRRALDEIASGSWRPSEEDMQELSLAFNREFTSGHLMGSRDVMGREISDNRGAFIGTVVSYDLKRQEASIRLAGTLAPQQGDGLVIISPGEELGMVVQRTPPSVALLRLRTPEDVRPGAKVFLTSSAALSRKAEGLMSKEKRIPVDLSVLWEEGIPVLCGAAQGPWGLAKAEVRADFRMEQALNQPLSAEQIEDHLRRTGGTPFIIRRLEMSYPGNLFAPPAVLNQLRRLILARLEEAILDKQRPRAENVLAAKKRLEGLDLQARAFVPPKEATVAVYADSLDTVRGALQGGCRRIYLEPRVGKGSDRRQKILEMLQEAREQCQEAELFWKWPRITRDSFLSLAGPLLAEASVDGLIVENLGSAEAARKARPGLELCGSAGLNVWNHLSVWELEPIFQRLTLSPELSLVQLADLISGSRSRAVPQMELMVQGNLEVVVAEDCLLSSGDEGGSEDDENLSWGLQDWKRIFPVRADDDGRTHIFNSAETCLVDHMPAIFQLGLDTAVDARRRTESYARNMAEIYQQAILMTQTGGGDLEKNLLALKEEARAISLGGITRGHFLRGLKEDMA
jgi:putative protease